MKRPNYIHLLPESSLPKFDNIPPFIAVVVIRSEVSNDWRNEVSDWLVESGCLHMMAWGHECSKWDDSVDWALLEKFDYKDFPDQEYVMTSWHDDESLDFVFWFAKDSAVHPSVELNNMLILDVGPVAREDSMLARYLRATHES